jgi:hypothetical protein
MCRIQHMLLLPQLNIFLPRGAIHITLLKEISISVRLRPTLNRSLLPSQLVSLKEDRFVSAAVLKARALIKGLRLLIPLIDQKAD